VVRSGTPLRPERGESATLIPAEWKRQAQRENRDDSWRLLRDIMPFHYVRDDTARRLRITVSHPVTIAELIETVRH
jgi:hypothetical protein